MSDDEGSGNGRNTHTSSSSTTSGNGHQQVHAATVHFKLPQFWRNNVALWFTKVETQFAISKINSERTRFNYVVAELDEQVMMEVSDVITDAPEGEQYSTLKQTMIDRFGESNENRIKKVLEGLTLGDRTPSALFRIMQTTAGANMNETTLRAIWRSRLPERIAEIMSAHEAADDVVPMATLIKIADRIHAQTRPSRIEAIASQPATSPSSTPSDPIQQLTHQISELTKRLSRMEQHSRRDRSPGRNNRNNSGNQNNESSNQNRSRSRSRSRLIDGLCYFHKKFGTEARKCSDGCNFSSSSQPSGNGTSQR